MKMCPLRHTHQLWLTISTNEKEVLSKNAYVNSIECSTVEEVTLIAEVEIHLTFTSYKCATVTKTFL